MQTPPAPQPVKPAVEGGRHVLAWDGARVEIDAATGGRVTALRFGGRNLLSEPAADAGNFGSTFWPSPQTAWGWPPLAEIDHGPYRAELEPAAIAMRSAINPALGVQVEKRFAADAGRAAVVFDFAIHNCGEAPTQLAPWQITRVPPGGLTLFPAGSGDDPPRPSGPHSNLAVRQALGVTWYAYDAVAVTDHQKLFADGREGWLAHVDGDALLVKTFAVVPRAAQAPGEAQIEIYATPAHTYIEIEAQGAYETIAPGAALSWRVVWLVRRLPAEIPRTVGSAPLLDFIRGVVETDRAAARG
ncbi:MAG TPA: DUF4380 domain-containing protein [Polyangia bacterium]|jgi:hypothetical protein|nr:DUF4380 domain-containing protein [Polyangia bacterium]